MRIARSTGDLQFETVAEIRASDIGVRSIERAALARHPVTGVRELYVSYHRKRWEIGIAWPSWDDVRDVRPLETLAAIEGVEGAKDPYIFDWGNDQLMLFTGYRGRLERTFLARRAGEGSWLLFSDEPLLPNDGWHRMFTRPSCVLPSQTGAVLYYEGCRGDEHEALYNIRAGVALTRDWHDVTDATPDEPMLSSPTPGAFSTIRYLAPVSFAGDMIFLYEAARPDGAFELRCSSAETVHLRADRGNPG